MPQKGKHRPPHQKAKKQHTGAPTVTAQPTIPTTAHNTTPAAPVKVVGRSTPQTVAAFTQSRYPFLGSELKWIGIIAAVIIVFLVILSIVLPPMFS